jgi:hypothetical protein
MSSAHDAGGTVSGRVRGLALAVCAVLLAHLVATFLWTAPGSLTGRADDRPASDVPATELPAGEVHGALEAYMVPVFAQSWSIFAPSPLHVEYSLHVRGFYADGPDGTPVPGPWTDTTAVEVRALTGHPLPAMTERLSRRLASVTRAAYLALPEPARDAVLRQPVGTRDPASNPWPALRATLLDTGAGSAVVDDYLAHDRALAAYVTQVLRASAAGAVDTTGTAGRDPVYVQASIVRRDVAPPGTGTRPAPMALTLGARPPVVVPGQDDDVFRDTWDALQAGEAGR